MYLFVYGTLKRGRSNHGYIDHCELVGRYFTDKNYTLVISGLPFLVKREGSGVLGEVYKIDNSTLRTCDRLEGHPGFYRRETIRVTNMDDGNELEVYAYIHPDIFTGEKYPWESTTAREF